VFDRMRARLRGDRRRCPLCFEGLAAVTELRACDACGTSYHAACFDELGGCGTAGCARSKRQVGIQIAPGPAPTMASNIFLSAFGGALLGPLVAYYVSASLLEAMRPVPLGAGALAGVALGQVIARFGERATVRWIAACAGLGLGTLLGLIVLICVAVPRWDADPPLEPHSPLLTDLPVLLALSVAALTAWFARTDEVPRVAQGKAPT
jgi:hypothetical protein